MVNLHQKWGWDHSLHIPLQVKEQIKELKIFLQPGIGRPFQTPPKRELYSDSSTWQWGVLDPTTGQYIRDLWRSQNVLHINQKESLAAVETVKALARPREVVRLNVDNLVAYSYLTKWGGRKGFLNEVLKPLFYFCQEKNITLQVDWVSSLNQLADGLTRYRRDGIRGTIPSTIIFSIVSSIFSSHTSSHKWTCFAHLPMQSSKSFVPELLIRELSWWML